MRRPLMSGFCAHPTDNDSHTRCHGGNTANPDNEFQPCPCACHLGETYECGGCGRDIREAPLLGPDPEDGDAQYVHVDPRDGRAVLGGCP